MVSQSKKRIRRFSFAVKIVILDDELEFSKILDKKIKAYCARKDLLYDCKIFSSSKSLLSEDLSSVQAAFLDIDLPDLNGLEIAAILRQRYPEMILIFVTSFIEYAPSGYKVNAFRYLLKAKLDEELSSCMDDLQEKLYENNRVIQIRQKDRFLPIAIKDILYFEGTSQRRVQAILTCGETIESHIKTRKCLIVLLKVLYLFHDLFENFGAVLRGISRFSKNEPELRAARR